jgi:hypothetical protein
VRLIATAVPEQNHGFVSELPVKRDVPTMNRWARCNLHRMPQFSPRNAKIAGGDARL